MTPAAPTFRPLMWLRLAALIAVAPIVWALARFDVLPHIRFCIFQNVTGRPCPGCGMTRSMLRLSLGDVAGSLRMHPLGVVLAGFVLAAALGTIAGLLQGGDPVARFLERRGVSLAIWLVVLFIGCWLVRGFLVPGWAPDPVGPAAPALTR